jgi:CRP-like cAMP-binding protein
VHLVVVASIDRIAGVSGGTRWHGICSTDPVELQTATTEGQTMTQPIPLVDLARCRPRYRRHSRTPLNPHVEPASNRLLALLSGTPSLSRLRPHLRLVGLKRHEVLHHQGPRATVTYFPTSSIVSLSCIAADGSSGELTSVGREGMIGVAALMGADSTGSQATVISPGDAWMLPAEALQREFAADEGCQALLLRYLHTLFIDISHHSLCDSNHCLQQRLCRLLLEIRYRGASDTLNATQEMLGQRLGVRRESVNMAASKLQDEGLIRYWRGRIRVIDRTGLAALSCECFLQIRTEYERLFAEDAWRPARGIGLCHPGHTPDARKINGLSK